MTLPQIELLVGLFFIGLSSSYQQRVFTIDLFKLIFGMILLVLALTKNPITG